MPVHKTDTPSLHYMTLLIHRSRLLALAIDVKNNVLEMEGPEYYVEYFVGAASCKCFQLLCLLEWKVDEEL